MKSDRDRVKSCYGPFVPEESRDHPFAPSEGPAAKSVASPAKNGAAAASDPIERLHDDVRALADSIERVVARQDRYERGLTLNSFVAYVLFTVLLVVMFLLLYHVRARQLVAETRAVEKRAGEYKARAESAQASLDAREAAARGALSLWSLLDEGRKEEALDAYPKLPRAHLSSVEKKLFDKEITAARAELVENSFREGLGLFNGDQYARAAPAFRRALAHEENGPRATQSRYYYGVSLFKVGDYKEAVQALDKAIQAGVERGVGPDARYFLGAALEKLGDGKRAAIEWEKFLAAHPRDRWAGPARRQLGWLRDKLDAPPTP